MKNTGLLALCLLVGIHRFNANAQNRIEIHQDKERKEVVITIASKPFTSLLYADSLFKPILFPVYSPAGQLITRGFPLQPRSGESADHPHHEGSWMNYENVNGIDFWNNSYAIPKEQAAKYGRIITDSVWINKEGAVPQLNIQSGWINFQKKKMMTEHTVFRFSGSENIRIIDRITTWTAEEDLDFQDAKDGLLGMRVTRELQLPSSVSNIFRDINGIKTQVDPSNSGIESGHYLASNGLEDDSVWSSSGNWCLLYGKKNSEIISIVMIDHPENTGYPTYWHARGYGLFAANPLGRQIFSKGKENLDFHLQKGRSVVFRYRIVIAGGDKRLSSKKIKKLSAAFARQH